MDRRDVLKMAGGTFLAGASCAYAFSVLIAETSGKIRRKPQGEASDDSSGEGDDVVSTAQRYRWGMLIDLNKCNECQQCNKSRLDKVPCVAACREENHTYCGEKVEDIPYNVFWIRRAQIEQEAHSRSAHTTGESEDARKFVILMCNHCDNPPCAQVCPVQATYRRKKDGVVIVDHHRCIGCRYCMIACPYNARWFNFKENKTPVRRKADGQIPQPKRSHGVAESCTFCAHRIGEWTKLNEDAQWNEEHPEWKKENPAPVPACVEACQEQGANALVFGDLDAKPQDRNIAELIADHAVKRIRDDLNTEPKVYYIGFPPKGPGTDQETTVE